MEDTDCNFSPPKWIKFFSIFGKILMVAWILAFIYLGYLFSPFVGAMYSISKIPIAYFEVAVNKKTGRASYKQVKTLPKDWVELNQISKRLRGAIISSEDGKFFSHPGYDIEELQDAIDEGVVKKKKKVRVPLRLLNN